MHELCSDGTVNTTADCPNNSPLRAADLTDARNFLANKLLLVLMPATVSDVLPYSGYLITDHGPMRRTVTNIENELSDDFSSAWRVSDLGVELDTIPRLVVVDDGCKGGSGRMPDDVEVCRDFG